MKVFMGLAIELAVAYDNDEVPVGRICKNKIMKLFLHFQIRCVNKNHL